MKHLLLGLSLSVSAAASAMAADMPVKAPAYVPPAVIATWTGCYVGANIGGGWNEKKIIDQEPALVGVSRGSHTSTGVVGGGQIGCDYQVNSFVFGVQGLFDGTDLSGSHLDPANPLITVSSKVSWLATVTGRVGFAVQPTTLLYVKAGGAWIRDHNFLTAVIGGVTVNQTSPDVTLGGWTVGGGIEYMFASAWSVFAEYNYMGIDTKRAIFTERLSRTIFIITSRLSRSA